MARPDLRRDPDGDFAASDGEQGGSTRRPAPA